MLTKREQELLYEMAQVLCNQSGPDKESEIFDLRDKIINTFDPD